MKKLLLSALAVVAFTTTVAAQEVSTAFTPADYAPEANATYTFKNAKTGFTFAGKGQVQNEDVLVSNGDYIALTANTNDYVITKVVVNAKNNSSLYSATLAGYSNEKAYTGSETTWVNPIGNPQSVTASYADYTFNVNNTYFALVAPGNGVVISEFTVYYQSKTAPEISFKETVVRAALGDKTVAVQALTKPADATGAVTYTSSNTAVATVDGETITLTGAGQTTITATIAAAGNYKKATATYELIVSAPAEPTTEVFNFSTAAPFGMGAAETDKTMAEGDVTLNIKGSFGVQTSRGANFVRLKKNTVLSVTLPSDATDAKVTFYGTDGTPTVVNGTSFTATGNTDITFVTVSYGTIPAVTMTWSGETSINAAAGQASALPTATNAAYYIIEGNKLEDPEYTFATSGVYWLEAVTADGLNVAFTKLTVFAPVDVVLEEGKARVSNVDGKQVIYCGNPEKYNWDVAVQFTIPAGVTGIYYEVSGTYATYANGEVVDAAEAFDEEGDYEAGSVLMIPAGITGTIKYEVMTGFGTSKAFEITLDGSKGEQSTGIEAVEAAAEGVVEYYNLQGIRVNEPAKGQLVIKKQGAKVSKVVF